MLCQTPTCTDPTAIPIPFPLTWDESVSFVVPIGTKPVNDSVWVRMCSPTSTPSPSSCATVALNLPDVWWVRGSDGDSVATMPDASVRVFGRALGWTNDSLSECISAMYRSRSNLTQLRLSPTADPIPSTVTTCYEATFFLPDSTPSGHYPTATVTTPWGSSTPFSVTVNPAPPLPSSVVQHVDSQWNGSVVDALAACPGTRDAPCVVQCGAHPYAFTAPLTVPPFTTLAGASSSSTKLTFTLPSSPTSSPQPAVSLSSHSTLANITALVLTAAAKTPVVAASDAQHVTITNSNITGVQTNVSNMIQLKNVHRFQVTDSSLHQWGVCLYPPTSFRTDFVASTSVYTMGSTDGLFSQNLVEWKCSWMDFDTTNRTVVEDNMIVDVVKGAIPHGNSVSSFAWRQNPSSRFWSYSHNTQKRPVGNDPSNFAFHETFTTDGAGGWGSGVVTAIDDTRTVVTVAFNVSAEPASPAGAGLFVLGGGATASFRQVVERVSDFQVRVSEPFGPHLQPGSSVVALTAFVGDKLVTGNVFRAGMVVQWFGTTAHGVIADNTFLDMNVHKPGAPYGDGALAGYGLCYSGQAMPMLFTEWTGNNMISSNGISLHENSQASCTANQPLPLIRHAVIRRNTIQGVAVSSPGMCGTVNVTNTISTDVLVEKMTFYCPAGNLFPGHGYNVDCTHCVVRVTGEERQKGEEEEEEEEEEEVAVAVVATPFPKLAYMVLEPAAWERAKSTGWYQPNTTDPTADIHMARASQVTWVLQNFFPSSSNESIAVVVLDEVKPPAQVVWKYTVPGQESFPHISGGPLSVTTINDVLTVHQPPAWSNSTICPVVHCPQAISE